MTRLEIPSYFEIIFFFTKINIKSRELDGETVFYTVFIFFGRRALYEKCTGKFSNLKE